MYAPQYCTVHETVLLGVEGSQHPFLNRTGGSCALPDKLSRTWSLLDPLFFKRRKYPLLYCNL